MPNSACHNHYKQDNKAILAQTTNTKTIFIQFIFIRHQIISTKIFRLDNNTFIEHDSDLRIPRGFGDRLRRPFEWSRLRLCLTAITASPYSSCCASCGEVDTATGPAHPETRAAVTDSRCSLVAWNCDNVCDYSLWFTLKTSFLWWTIPTSQNLPYPCLTKLGHKFLLYCPKFNKL